MITKAPPLEKHVPTSSGGDEAEEKLLRLKKMYEKGLITEDEYKNERSEVLEEL